MSNKPNNHRLKKKVKPGPTEERLIITGDSELALGKLLKKPSDKNESEREK